MQPVVVLVAFPTVEGASLRDAMNNFCDWFSTERCIPNGMQMRKITNPTTFNYLLQNKLAQSIVVAGYYRYFTQITSLG
jgi:hypothetical protein